jgi:hypothetical protein
VRSPLNGSIVGPTDSTPNLDDDPGLLRELRRTLIAVATLCLWLAAFPLRQRHAWALWAFFASGALGFGSFLSYLGYGPLAADGGECNPVPLPLKGKR